MIVFVKYITYSCIYRNNLKDNKTELIDKDDFVQLSADRLELSKDELKTIKRKIGVEHQLLFAVMLKHYQIKLKFPDKHDDLVLFLAQYLSKILNVSFSICLDFDDRISERFRNEIRKILGFREATDNDAPHFINWLVCDHLHKVPQEHETKTALMAYYRASKIEPFSDNQQARYLDAARKKFETQLFEKINHHLSPEDKAFIDSILNSAAHDEKVNSKEINLNTLKKGIPGAKLKHVQFAVEKYEAIETLWLPDSITAGLSRKILLKYYDRIMAYSPSHIDELDECAKYAMIAMFCHVRAELFADSLGGLFEKLVRKIKTSSENHVKKTVVQEVKRVDGKLDILYKLTEAALDHPYGVIRNTIYPVVDIETLRRIKEDLSQRGNWYKKQVRKKMRSLYSRGSRTELLGLLSLLKFNARDDDGKALLAAINFIIKHRDTAGNVYNGDEQAPIAGIIPNDWLDFIVEDQVIPVDVGAIVLTLLQPCVVSECAAEVDILIDANAPIGLSEINGLTNETNTSIPECGSLLPTPDSSEEQYQPGENQTGYQSFFPICSLLLSNYLVILKSHLEHINKTNPPPRVNKLSYEMVVCGEVRRKLNYKGIWIDEGYRYRDPKKDEPSDFDKNKEKFYKELGLPLDVQEFISLLKADVTNCLSSLNETILANDKVTISDKKGGHIKISPSLPQKLPENLVDLHNEIIKRWGYINLIDAFQESNVRIGFTRHLETVGKYSNMDTDNLAMRLLLSLYAIGTNTGLKRISIANPDVNEADLHYVKRRCINQTNVKLAIREVINAVISIRDPAIFGTATTTVACDSKKLNSWDQNLMNEWHGRYKGHGIMVYWHVDTNALCIHSQSKTCTSSEVGSMIKGILQHSTQMDLNAAYVDTHGQSTIGFGVGKLLNFELLPRLKNIHKQKLYTVSDSDKQSYANLSALLKDSIQWKHIEADYHEAVKHIVALKHGLVEADVFVKRFSKDNYKHPAYKALCEIGKATKTIFLCKYLQQEELRIEINAGLNVVERLNGVMNFFFYGKLGEINSNDLDEQELSILCLHLLQACSVYINTLLIQEILSDPSWRNKLTPEDYRALSPLIHSHFNPYGTFILDLAKRLMINIKDFAHDREQSNTRKRESKAVNQAA